MFSLRIYTNFLDDGPMNHPGFYQDDTASRIFYVILLIIFLFSLILFGIALAMARREMGRAQYSRLETGNNFNMTTLFRLLDAYGMSLAEFFAEFEEKKEAGLERMKAGGK